MAEEEPLAQLILEVLRRRRRATLREIVEELFLEVRSAFIERVLRVLRRMEIAGLVVRHEERVRGPVFRYVYYDLRPLRRLLRPGRRFTSRELAQLLGIPLVEIRERVIPFALQRRYFVQTAADMYEVPRPYRVQKFRVYSTEKNPQYYQVKFHERMPLPTQLVLENYARREETDELVEGTVGAVRVVVYTYNPDLWPEERLASIMRALFAQERITFEIYEKNISRYQAYEVREIEPDEIPSDADIDEPQIFLWVSKRGGFTYVYEYTRKPWGWEYRRSIVR